MCALLLDLEAIERVMVEKQNKKLKAKGKASTACPDAKSYWCDAHQCGTKSNAFNLILRLFFVPYFAYNELVVS
jgi:hypothetical protein